MNISAQNPPDSRSGGAEYERPEWPGRLRSSLSRSPGTSVVACWCTVPSDGLLFTVMTVTVDTGNVQQEPNEWSIDELAGASGVPTRTIREYRTLGVLPAPERRGRVGVYGDRHLDRLALIGRLQARGYSLAGIRDLLDAWAQGGSLASVLHADGEGPSTLDEAPVSMTVEQLGQVVAGLAEPGHLVAAERAGLIVRDGDRIAVRSPALLRVVAEAVTAGVPIDEALDVAGRFRDGARVQAMAVVGAFVERVWDGDGSTDATQQLAQRGRFLLAQAAASVLTDELGRALIAAGDTSEGRGLDELAEQIRVGAVFDRPEEEQA